MPANVFLIVRIFVRETCAWPEAEWQTGPYRRFLNDRIPFGAYPESPSYHENSPVGAASSREIK